MTTYLVATAEPPNIVCPRWCVVPAEEHIADLEDWEGMVIHWSSDRELAPGLTARIASNTTPAGEPDPSEPLSIHLDSLGMPAMSADVAQAAGEVLAMMAAEARSIQDGRA